MENIFKILVFSVGIAMAILIFGVLFALPVMWAWNHVIPKVFQLPTITWLEAWCLIFLGGMFFKSSTTSTKE